MLCRQCFSSGSYGWPRITVSLVLSSVTEGTTCPRLGPSSAHSGSEGAIRCCWTVSTAAVTKKRKTAPAASRAWPPVVGRSAAASFFPRWPPPDTRRRINVMAVTSQHMREIVHCVNSTVFKTPHNKTLVEFHQIYCTHGVLTGDFTTFKQKKSCSCTNLRLYYYQGSVGRHSDSDQRWIIAHL
jgi:hypothetical protein